MSQSGSDYTTVSIRRETYRKLQDLKPYSSMSFDEFIGEMADNYRGE